jgi:HSP20 family protein
MTRTLTRWDPFAEMVPLRQAMDRLFEGSLVGGNWLSLNGGGMYPQVDIHEAGDDLVVTAVLPGVKPEDVNVTLTGQTLSIRGEIKADESVQDQSYLYQERRFGQFDRQFQLPFPVEGDHVQATYENGLLKLTIPKAEHARPRRIQIGGGSEPRQVGASSGTTVGATTS